MASFRFLHAADVHLDSPLRGLARYEGVPADEVRTATRTAFIRLVDAAIEHEVAFVVLAGDLFDGEPKDVGARHAVATGFGALGRAGIPVYALTGNHDAASSIRATLPAMPHVHWFDTLQPQTLLHEPLGVALHGQGFAQREVTLNLAARYPDRRPGLFNLGVLHTSLTGYDGHAPYAPCTVPELLAKGYDYWALGHVHAHAVVHPDPPVVFPGCLQGRTIREDGAKGAVLVDVADGRVQALRHLPLDVVRWATIGVDTHGAADLPAVAERLRSRLEHAMAHRADGRPLLVRVVLDGTTALHDALQGWAQGWGRESIQLLAASVSHDIWVEKIALRTAPVPASSTATLPVAGDLGDLAALLDAPDPAMVERLRAELAAFVARQPAAEPGSLLEAARTGAWDGLVARAGAALRARLDAAG